MVLLDKKINGVDFEKIENHDMDRTAGIETVELSGWNGMHFPAGMGKNIMTVGKLNFLDMSVLRFLTKLLF